MGQTYTFFVTAPQHFEGILGKELRELGCTNLKPAGNGFFVEASLEEALRIRLWSTLANRLILQLCLEEAKSQNDLLNLVRNIPWESHFSDSTTFMVETGSLTKSLRAAGFRHTRFLAQSVKDGIVDRLRKKRGLRPEVNLEEPGLRIHVGSVKDRVQIGIDLGDGSLHTRGYRVRSGPASLKENLAAGLLVARGWKRSDERVFVDPLCGTGTLVLEAAMMALNIAPGLLRPTHSQHGWAQYPFELWDQLIQEAKASRIESMGPRFFGFDRDAKSLETARQALERLDLQDSVVFQRLDLTQWEAKQPQIPTSEQGMLLTNPPYGERLGELAELNSLYRRLEYVARLRFPDWSCGVLTSHAGLAHRIGLRASSTSSFKNGPIDCKLYHFRIPEDGDLSDPSALNESEIMLFNRLKKNMKRLASWLKREHVTCYRHYDADMPEYNAAIDVYENDVVIYEYAPPCDFADPKVEKRRFEMLQVVPAFFEVPPERVHYKVRTRQKGANQYTRQDRSGEVRLVKEHDLTYEVNLQDYLDTGLFLDHRPLRKMIKGMARGVEFLNLFAYTGTASACALAGGARRVTTVDLSKTYLEWAKRNMKRNGFQPQVHRFVEADVFNFLKRETGMYDLIYLDPPSFSNSKKFRGSFDVQRDHVPMIRLCMERLRTHGSLLFSNNLKTFVLEQEKLKEMGYFIKDLTEQTIPQDFKRSHRIHHCFLLSWKEL